MGVFLFLSCRFHSRWSSSPDRKVDPTEESVLHSALREAKEKVGTDVDKIEIGRFGPPTQSLNGFRVWPYVVSFECCSRLFRQVTFVKVFLHEKSYGSTPDGGDASPLPSPSLSSLTLFQVEVTAASHLRLNHFTDPRYLQEHRSCESTVYWVCNITDFVAPGIEWSNAGADSKGGVGGGHIQQTWLGTVWSGGSNFVVFTVAILRFSRMSVRPQRPTSVRSSADRFQSFSTEYYQCLQRALDPPSIKNKAKRQEVAGKFKQEKCQRELRSRLKIAGTELANPAANKVRLLSSRYRGDWLDNACF